MALVLLSSCGGGIGPASKSQPSKGVVTDLNASAGVEISARKMPSYQDLKRTLRVEAETAPALGPGGRNIEGATVASWYFEAEPFVKAFFATSPVKDDAQPFEIELRPPFKGRVFDFVIGEEREVRWDALVERGKHKCGQLLDFLGTEKGLGHFPGFAPICEEQSRFPTPIPSWGVYGVSPGSTAITERIKVINFRAKTIERAGQLYVFGTKANELVEARLAEVFTNSLPDDILKLGLDFFAKSNTDWYFMAHSRMSKTVFSNQCKFVSPAKADFYTKVASGVRGLITDLGIDPHSKQYEAAEQLAIYEAGYAKATRAVVSGCSGAVGQFGTVQEDLRSASEAGDRVRALLSEALSQ